MEGYALDELTELREKEQLEEAKIRAAQEKEQRLEQMRNAFLDCTEDFFEELFAKTVEPENVTVLQCYGQLKEDYRDKLNDDIKATRSWLEEKNEIRMKKVASFEKAISTAEKESEDEALQLIRQFMSLKKKVIVNIDSTEGPGGKTETLV